MELAENQKEALTKYILSLGITFEDDVNPWQIFNEEGIMYDVTLKDALKIITEVITIEKIMYEVLKKYSVLIPVCVLEEYIK